MDPADLTVSHAGPGTAIPRSQWLKQGLGYLLAIVCLVWVFHDFQLPHLRAQLANIQWKWIYLAVAVDILSYLCQGKRWQLLLRPLGSVSVLRTTQAIYVGLFANELLPMRIGELVRGYLVSQGLRAKFIAVVPSLIIERFFDGVWLAVGIGLTAIFVPLPRDLLEAGDVLGILLLIGTAGFVYVILRRKDTRAHAQEAPSSQAGLLRAVESFINHLAAALRTLGTTKGFYFAFCFSAGVLILQALALWAVMLAYGLPLSFLVGFMVLVIMHLGTAIPNAPANLGTYQFFCVVGMTLFGVNKPLATGFSVVAFVILTVPLWVIGGFALSQTGTTLSAIGREVSRPIERRRRPQ